MPGQALELRTIAGRVRVSWKLRHPDAGDAPPPVEPIGADGEIAEFE